MLDEVGDLEMRSEMARHLAVATEETSKSSYSEANV